MLKKPISIDSRRHAFVSLYAGSLVYNSMINIDTNAQSDLLLIKLLSLFNDVSHPSIKLMSHLMWDDVSLPFNEVLCYPRLFASQSFKELLTMGECQHLIRCPVHNHDPFMANLIGQVVKLFR